MAEVQRLLQSHLDRMRQEHQAANERLKTSEARLITARSSVLGQEAAMSDSQARYTFFQETRSYLQDLLECLDVKAPVLEDIEEDMSQARRRRSEALRKRRTNDLTDGVQAALETIGKGSKKSTELDEFGRDPSMQRDRRMKARAERRQSTGERRRRMKGGAQEAPIGGREAIVEEMWTSDESDSEVAEWRKVRSELVHQADDLFSDVRREFRDLKAIQSRMMQWRARFPKSYREAWVAMSLPRLLAPHVRKETIGWEPLDGGQTLESLQWISDLFAADDGAEDDDIIPSLVKEVICPKISQAIRNDWDPSSAGATARAVALLNDVLVFILDAAPDSARALCEEVPMALGVELDRCTAAMQLFLREKESDGDLPARPVFNVARASFVRCCKLVKNAAAWRDVVSPASLQEFVFDNVCRRHLTPFLRALKAKHPSDALDLARLLRESIPGEWQERPGMRAIDDLCS